MGGSGGGSGGAKVELPQGIWHILRVLKPVKKGEEIVIDYGASYADNQKILSGI